MVHKLQVHITDQSQTVVHAAHLVTNYSLFAEVRKYQSTCTKKSNSRIAEKFPTSSVSKRHVIQIANSSTIKLQYKQPDAVL